MRKILLFLALLAPSFIQAQQDLIPAPSNQKPLFKPQFDRSKMKSLQPKSQAAKGSSVFTEYWLNYGSSIDQFNGGGAGMTGPATISSNYLFPDSLCYGEFGAGNFAPCWVHHLGDVLDVKSLIFNQIDGVTWDATTAYSLDSLAISYAYTRVESVVDTLVITLITNSTAGNMPGYYFYDPTFTANYGTDTVCFRALKYFQPANSIDAIGKYTFKVTLDDADTAITFFREKQFAVPGSYAVAADKLLAVDIQFIPGYSYALGDSIDYQHNAFFFTSLEEFGDNGGTGTYQSYWDCNNLSAACDYNCSHIVPQDVRYDMAAGWNGLFIPSYAYTVGYSFEHHLISYKVSSGTIGISEASHGNAFMLKNQPNPFTDKTTISYELKKGASNVNIKICDVRGVLVFETNETNMKAGVHTFDINSTEFSTGVYFCTMNADGVQVTTKIVAQ